MIFVYEEIGIILKIFIINECISLKDDKDLFYSYASN